MVTRQLFRLANGIVFVCLFGAAGIRAASSLDARSALAGGLAGGMTNGILHPIDTAKTLRQRNPKEFKTTFGALVKCYKTQGIRGLYGGFGPAVVGAIPSSALYFGAYGNKFFLCFLLFTLFDFWCCCFFRLTLFAQNAPNGASNGRREKQKKGATQSRIPVSKRF